MDFAKFAVSFYLSEYQVAALNEMVEPFKEQFFPEAKGDLTVDDQFIFESIMSADLCCLIDKTIRHYQYMLGMTDDLSYVYDFDGLLLKNRLENEKSDPE